MDYHLDLDPTHLVLRTTVTTNILTLELAEDLYRRLSLVASCGGPYASILDLSGVTRSTITAEVIRGFAQRAPAVPAGRTRVAVAKQPSVYGVARMFQLWRDSIGGQLEVVQSLEEAYDMVGASPEDFTERVFPKDLAA